jgi:lipase maturation factor 1
MQDWELARQGGGSESYLLSSWIFLRLLGLIYLAAFVSLAVQVNGLIGSRGILPARDFLLSKRAWGRRRFLQIPTLCWWNADDRFLQFLCWGGAGLAMLLAVNVAPLPVIVLLWVFYLSLFNVSRLFLGYQWDILLLETGFLAIFLAPFELVPASPPATAPSPIILWLLWWLLFRLMFSSGFVKFRSGDRAWRTFTALTFHYETQPLPPWTAWYMHRLPAWFHKLSVAVMFLIELLAPFLIFVPSPFSYAAGAAFVFFMVLIMATGNYCFFNLLAIALSALLFDDAVWLSLFQRFVPTISVGQAALPSSWPLGITIPVAAIILLLSVDIVGRLVHHPPRWPRWMEVALEWLEPFRLVSPYGLFSVMTTERPEIIIEGSNDGLQWQAYEFKWKPGDVKRRPRFVAPHQPRLDWQMWFAALGFYPNNPWLRMMLIRLLRGSEDVIALLERNPFPDQPPKFIRAAIYDYRFTDFARRRATGEWWRRERRGLYSPVLSLGSQQAENGSFAGTED